MNTEKQDFELKIVDLFRTAGGLEEESKIMTVPKSKERPDVIALVVDKRIGIEVRRLLDDEHTNKGSNLLKRYSIFQSIIDLAENMHSKLTNRCYIVRVHFFQNSDINFIAKRKNKRIEKIANMLVDLISNFSIETGTYFSLDSEVNWHSSWPDEVQSVIGVVIEGDGSPDWGFSDNFLVSDTSASLIQSALDKKERHISSWRHDYDESWCLLVLAGNMIRAHEELNRNIYESSFDRAFVIEYYGQAYKELSLHIS
jgi:hypothetical protein